MSELSEHTDERLDADVTRWREEYAAYSPEVDWRSDTIVRHARQRRSKLIARRVGTLAALAAAITVLTVVLDRPSPPGASDGVRPAGTATYSFSTSGCAATPRTCAPVIEAWLAKHGLAATVPVAFLDRKERPQPKGATPMRWEEGYVDAEISLTAGTAASPVSLFVQISPTTTMTLEPAASRDLAPLGGVRTRLRDGTSAMVVGPGSQSAWASGILVQVDAAPGVHPAIDVDLSRGNLSNGGISPPLPPEVNAQSVVELVNALL